MYPPFLFLDILFDLGYSRHLHIEYDGTMSEITKTLKNLRIISKGPQKKWQQI